MAGPHPSFVWPYGQSAGSARRSDESPEEKEAWEKRCSDYLTWRDTHYPMSITPVNELTDEDKPVSYTHLTLPTNREV